LARCVALTFEFAEIVSTLERHRPMSLLGAAGIQLDRLLKVHSRRRRQEYQPCLWVSNILCETMKPLQIDATLLINLRSAIGRLLVVELGDNDVGGSRPGSEQD
jgi:hypothetical protein